jgi:hypothetical protein
MAKKYLLIYLTGGDIQAKCTPPELTRYSLSVGVTCGKSRPWQEPQGRPLVFVPNSVGSTQRGHPHLGLSRDFYAVSDHAQSTIKPRRQSIRHVKYWRRIVNEFIYRDRFQVWSTEFTTSRVHIEAMFKSNGCTSIYLCIIIYVTIFNVFLTWRTSAHIGISAAVNAPEHLNDGLINYILKTPKQNVVIEKNWPVKGLCGRCLPEFIDWRMEIQSVMLVFSTLICELLPL